MKKITAFFLIVVLNINIFGVSSVSADFADTRLPVDSLFNYAKITDSYSDPDNKSLVIWIQDLHNDFAVQKDIYDMLGILSAEENLKGIYTEGALSGLLDVSALKNINDNIVQNLFRSSVLSACEYFALNNKNIRVYGIENEQIYGRNLSVLNNITKYKQLNNYISQKAASYAADLKKRYLTGNIISLQTADFNNIRVNDNFPNIYRQQQILKDLRAINSRDLNLQMAALAQNQMILGFFKYGTDHGYAKAYDYICSYLPNITKINPDAMLYLKTRKLLSQINPVNLLYEKEKLAAQLLTNADLDETEKEITDLNYFCELLKNLTNTSILPEHYVNLKENKRYFGMLAEKYFQNDIKVFVLNLLNSKDLFDFYDTNLTRNQIFASSLKSEGNDVKIIVAGGFHSGLKDELKRLHQPYMVLTPNISVKDAFNKLFITGFNNNASPEQITDNFLSVVKQMGVFFTTEQSFRDEVSKWINQTEQLKGIETDISEVTGGYRIDVIFKGVRRQETFMYGRDSSGKHISNKINFSKRQVQETLNKISDTARQPNLFGTDVKITTNNDSSLFDSPFLLPVKILADGGKTVISVNKNFLKGLSAGDETLIDTVVRLLYFYSLPKQNVELFGRFIQDNYDDLEQIYEINKQAQFSSVSFFTKLKSKLKNIFGLISALLPFNFKDFEEPIYVTQDQKNMAEALKQAELARQSRSYLRTFTQPPVGAYIVNSDGITGRNFNADNSILHAETLALIDFLKNYIIKEESLPNGELTDKGQLLSFLLDIAIINGQHVTVKCFQNRPMILENLGIHIDYTKAKSRNVDAVFNETNAVLRYVNEQLGNPLASAAIYCTLAPCNKCANTMSTVGIHKLFYGSHSVNKKHNSLDILKKNGIIAEGGLLENETDRYILPYGFMNTSLFMTKIASFIQQCRRIISSMFKKMEFNQQNILYSAILKLELHQIKQSIVNLQNDIDWSYVSQSEHLPKLQALLQQIGTWDDPVKRASMIYVIKNKLPSYIKNDRIRFKNKLGVTLDFYIDLNNGFIASDNYTEKMKKLSKIRNLADLDDNLALRKTEFNMEVSSIFSILSLYGMAQPIIITGNTLDETNRRLEPLGKIICDLIPTVFTEHGALEYDKKEGAFKKNEEYMKNIAHSYISPAVLDDIQNIFKTVKKDWLDLFVDFAADTKNIRISENGVTYAELASAALEKNGKGKMSSLVSLLNLKSKRQLISLWGALTSEQAEKKINEIYLSAGRSNERNFLDIMKIISILELARIYCSKNPEDEKEIISLNEDLQICDSGKRLKTKFDSESRYVVSPLRPTFVRNVIADYYNKTINKKYPNLTVKSSGHTTLSVYGKHVDKTIPIRQFLGEGIPAEYIIYTGDDFSGKGVDYPIYLLQRELGAKTIVAINTDGEASDEDFISLVSLPSFSNEKSVKANIERNVTLQSKILEILEENIGKIAADPTFEPENIAQELKNSVTDIPVVTQFSETKPKIENIKNLLQAG